MIAHRRDHALIHLGRMRSHEPQPAYAFDFCDSRKQRAEIAAAHRTAICVDGLTEQLDFDAAGVDGGAHLRKHVVKCP